jgi:CheY-specific phosphatase CheX
MAGVETTPRTGEAVESEESSSSSSSSEDCSSFEIAVVIGVAGEISVVASFATETVAAVVAAAAVLAVVAAAADLAAPAAVARGFLFDGPGANRRGSPASS